MCKGSANRIKYKINAHFSCISAFFFVSLHLVKVRQNPKVSCLLAAAKRYSHARHKTLPRPPQQFATGGANWLHPVSLPVTSGLNPCQDGPLPLSALIKKTWKRQEEPAPCSEKIPLSAISHLSATPRIAFV